MQDIDYTKAGAVQNDWYTAFEGSNVEIILLAAGITVANETVDVRITIDGKVFTSSGAEDLLFATNLLTMVTDIRTVSLTINKFDLAAPSTSAIASAAAVGNRWIKGKSVKVEVRKTTAGGASALRVVGQYFQW